MTDHTAQALAAYPDKSIYAMSRMHIERLRTAFDAGRKSVFAEFDGLILERESRTPNDPLPLDTDLATADSALNEVEFRLRADKGYAPSDQIRMALLHIEAYREGRARRTNIGVHPTQKCGNCVLNALAMALDS